MFHPLHSNKGLLAHQLRAERKGRRVLFESVSLCKEHFLEPDHFSTSSKLSTMPSQTSEMSRDGGSLHIRIQLTEDDDVEVQASIHSFPCTRLTESETKRLEQYADRIWTNSSFGDRTANEPTILSGEEGWDVDKAGSDIMSNLNPDENNPIIAMLYDPDYSDTSTGVDERQPASVLQQGEPGLMEVAS